MSTTEGKFVKRFLYEQVESPPKGLALHDFMLMINEAKEEFKKAKDKNKWSEEWFGC